MIVAGAPAAAIILLLGCSTSGDKTYVPPISSDAKLYSLSVASLGGDIVQPFAPGTLHYTIPTTYAADPGTVVVTAALDNYNATMTINGVRTTTRTASDPIPLTVGDNDIPIVITAQDGKTVQTYHVSCTIFPQNTKVHVQDSINGVAVPTATLTVADSTGAALQTAIPVDAMGNATLGLDPTAIYNLSATGAGTAQSLFAGFNPSKEASVNFYCHPLGMINFPAKAAKFTAINYGPDGSTWTPVTDSSISDSSLNLTYLQVTALGTSDVASTAWSGFGMGLTADQQMSYYGNFWSPAFIEEQSVPVVVGDATFFRTTADLWFPALSASAPDTKHYLDLVAYDVANNRTETKLYVNVTDGAADATQFDLSTIAPSKVVAQLSTFGLSRNTFGIAPVDGNPITYQPAIYFSVLNAAGNAGAGITGYDVLRSMNGSAWTKVGSYMYYGPNASTSSYSFIDQDPTLVLGQTYYYKVRAFNNNTTHNGGYSQDSPVVGAQFLPPFTLNLAAPATESVSLSLKPTFRFSISNPALFDPTVSDFFYFTLSIREMTGTAATSTVTCRYNFAAGRFEYKPAASWVDATSLISIDAAKTNIAIMFPNSYFQPGVSYEWSIYGTSTSNANHFWKYTYPYGDSTSTSFAQAISQGSTYEQGYGAVNGYFILSIDPNAK